MRDTGRRQAHNQHSRRPAASAGKGLEAVTKRNAESRKEYDRKYGQIKVK